MTDVDCSEIVHGLKRSRKYAHTCEETLMRVAAWSAERHRSPKEALKAAKRKLHQVYGAYLEPASLRKVAEQVAALPSSVVSCGAWMMRASLIA